MLQSTANLSSGVECPQCGKNAIVSFQTGVYKCLSCDFERNLGSEPLPAKTEGGLGEVIFAGLGFLVVIALFL